MILTNRKLGYCDLNCTFEVHNARVRASSGALIHWSNRLGFKVVQENRFSLPELSLKDFPAIQAEVDAFARAELMKGIGFIPQRRSHLENDTLAEEYRGWKIMLCIPNGGILAVSIALGEECYGLATAGVDDRPGYSDEEGHIRLGRGAIDLLLGSV